MGWLTAVPTRVRKIQTAGSRSAWSPRQNRGIDGGQWAQVGRRDMAKADPARLPLRQGWSCRRQRVRLDATVCGPPSQAIEEGSVRAVPSMPLAACVIQCTDESLTGPPPTIREANRCGSNGHCGGPPQKTCSTCASRGTTTARRCPWDCHWHSPAPGDIPCTVIWLMRNSGQLSAISG